MDITSFILGTKVAGNGGAGVKYVVVEELPTTGEEGTIYLVPKSTSQTDNVYNEYMYINENWELIGDTQADLTDYVKNTDYATGGKGGVIKTGYSVSIDSNGNIYAQNKSYTDYQSMSNNNFISKGTLENVIDGKGLITQYSTLPTASATNEGKIVQFTGTTDSTYTNGYYYKCVSDGQNPATYSWENINVQAGGSGGTPIITQNTNINDLNPGLYIVNKGINIYLVKNDTYTYIGNQEFNYILQVGALDSDNTIPFIAISFGMYTRTYGSSYSYQNNFSILAGRGGIYTSYVIPKGVIANFTDNSNGGNYGNYINLGDGGYISCSNYNYSTYNSKGDNIFISKGTLNNVIAGKELDLKQLSTYDATKTQVLKNINGTLTWVDEA